MIFKEICIVVIINTDRIMNRIKVMLSNSLLFGFLLFRLTILLFLFVKLLDIVFGGLQFFHILLCPTVVGICLFLFRKHLIIFGVQLFYLWDLTLDL